MAEEEQQPTWPSERNFLHADSQQATLVVKFHSILFISCRGGPSYIIYVSFLSFSCCMIFRFCRRRMCYRKKPRFSGSASSHQAHVNSRTTRIGKTNCKDAVYENARDRLAMIYTFTLFSPSLQAQTTFHTFSQSLPTP